ncbi:MAG TPA: aminopeptidase [Rectinemataceae bacterium]
MDEELEIAARIAVSDCLGLLPSERFLIITNPDTEQEMISEALLKAAKDLGARARIVLQPKKTQADYAEDEVIEAIAEGPEAMASVSAGKIGKDRKSLARPLVASDGKTYDHVFDFCIKGERRSRAFWSPGISLDMFRSTVAIDYAWMRGAASKLKATIDSAFAISVRSPGGTDLVFGVEGRKAFLDDGDFRERGSGGNLPAGEVFVSPALRSAEGEIVFDASLSCIEGTIVTSEPVACTIAKGFVLDVRGGEEARLLEASLRTGIEMASGMKAEGLSPEECMEYAVNSRHLGEFGIGLNRKAHISGRMLEDEKVYGTCHFAFGFNYDGDAKAMIHLDCLVKRPSITALMPDGSELPLMEEGVLVPEMDPEQTRGLPIFTF